MQREQQLYSPPSSYKFNVLYHAPKALFLEPQTKTKKNLSNRIIVRSNADSMSLHRVKKSIKERTKEINQPNHKRTATSLAFQQLQSQFRKKLHPDTKSLANNRRSYNIGARITKRSCPVKKFEYLARYLTSRIQHNHSNRCGIGNCGRWNLGHGSSRLIKKPGYETRITKRDRFGTRATTKADFGERITKRGGVGARATRNSIVGYRITKKRGFGTRLTKKTNFGERITKRRGAGFGYRVTRDSNMGTRITKKRGFGSRVTRTDDLGERITKKGGAGLRVTRNFNVGTRITKKGGFRTRVTKKDDFSERITKKGGVGSRVTRNSNVGNRITKKGRFGTRVTRKHNLGMRLTKRANFSPMILPVILENEEDGYLLNARTNLPMLTLPQRKTHWMDNDANIN